MKTPFGLMPDGTAASIYTITGGGITAQITDCGGAIVRLLVPDAAGNTADVVLGFDSPEAYLASATFMGAAVGRNANRIKNAAFLLGGRPVALTPNENGNNLHSGPDFYKDRLWTVEHHGESSLRLALHSPHGDQGYPGNAVIRVTYALEAPGTLHITYDAVCDRDTVFNLTNHSYFNLAGHQHPEKAMEQLLSLPARYFTPADAESIPVAAHAPVEGTPMDFRVPKAIGRDIETDHSALKLQHGYDHNFEVFAQPCATLSDPGSGRSMAVYTDCKGIQFYSGNFLSGEQGKDGAVYSRRSGICLETQFYPDSVNHPEWPQPVTPAGQRYHSETKYCFAW